jgi:integrase/recombinase XerD
MQAMKKTIYELTSCEHKKLHEEFIIYLKTLGYSESTVMQLPLHVKEFLHRQGKHRNRITAISTKDILAHYEYLETRPSQTKHGGLSSSSISSHLYAIRFFFKWLEETGVIQTNPISGLSFPNTVYKARSALTILEIQQLYEAAETYKDKAILGLFYGCGLRRGEGEKLNTADIKLKEKVLIVKEGKGQRRRVIPLAERVKQDFENYYNYERQSYVIKEESAFMLNNKGRRMNRDNYKLRLKYLINKSGIKQTLCLHQLRHSIATHLMEQGMSLEKVRDFLGHKNIDTTQRYTHLNKLKLI